MTEGRRPREYAQGEPADTLKILSDSARPGVFKNSVHPGSPLLKRGVDTDGRLGVTS
jgi:hypothetical protein